MKLFLLVLAGVAVAGAGELGIRLESPRETLGWVSQTWAILGLSLSVHGEAQLMPLGFQRGVLSLSGSGAWGTWKLEGVVFGSGRMDAFLSSSLSRSFSLGPAAVRLAAGGKWGWAALNLAPLWLGTFWALAEAEGKGWMGKAQWEGPPGAFTLRVAAEGIALSLGNIVSLELFQTRGDWTLDAQIQIVPAKEQKITVVWSGAPGTLRAWLGLRGSGLRLAQSAGPWNVLFSLSWGTGLQGTLEITRAF